MLVISPKIHNEFPLLICTLQFLTLSLINTILIYHRHHAISSVYKYFVLCLDKPV
jgi:hypothetical protein